MHCCWHNHCILLCVRVRACVCMCASVCVVQETRYSSFFHSRERQVFSFAHNKNSDAHKLSNTLTHIHTAQRQTIAGLVCTDLPFGPPERIGALKYRNFVTTLSQTRTYNPPDSRFSVCACVCAFLFWCDIAGKLHRALSFGPPAAQQFFVLASASHPTRRQYPPLSSSWRPNSIRSPICWRR